MYLFSMKRIFMLAASTAVLADLPIFAQDLLPFSPTSEIENHESQESKSAVLQDETGIGKITLIPDRTSTSERTFLHEIATCEGNTSACMVANNLDLGLAPLPGEQKIFFAEDIKKLLDGELSDYQWEIVGPAKINVSAQSIIINKEEIESYLRDVLALKLRDQNALRLKHFKVLFAKKINLRPATYRLSIPSVQETDFSDVPTVADKLSGRRVLEVYCLECGFSENEVASKASVHFEFEIQIPVPTLAMKAGHKITHSDLQYQWIALSRLTTNAIGDIKSLVGKSLAHDMRAGLPITNKMLSEERLVDRGSLIKLIMRLGTLNITGSAKALANGVLGEQIKVFYPSTKKTLIATVIGENIVEVTRQ